MCYYHFITANGEETKLRCPVCNEKIPKKTDMCPSCGFRVPPEPSFIQRLMFLPIPEILFSLVIIAGICLLVYRFALPAKNQEPIINLSDQLKIDTNVGVIFFDHTDNSLINEISESIKKLDIDGDCEVKYKYNTDQDCYREAVSTLVGQDKCKNILITGKSYHNVLLEIAKDFKDTNFYVLWGTDEYTSASADNIQICRADISKAVYSIGVNSAHYLTEKIKAIDVTDPAFSETNHTVIYLYKTDTGYSYYEQFASGVKKINPNLGVYAVKVEDENEYAAAFKQSEDIYTVMAADEMPLLTEALAQAPSDNLFLSGVTEDVIKYPNYLCAIKIDNSTFIDNIFHSISDGTALVPIHNGAYDDSFCRLEYNKKIIGNLK